MIEPALLPHRPYALDCSAILNAYNGARRRTLFLDYDGTLVPYASRPEDARPPAEIASLLETLAAPNHNCVVLISGRNRRDLEAWFGHVRGLWLGAEHGALLRKPGTTSWQPLGANFSPHWRDRLRSVLTDFVELTPGSFVEEKEYSLVWHYRVALAPTVAEKLAQQVVATLEHMLAGSELHVIKGRKAVEVKPIAIHKGAVMNQVITDCGPADFQLAIGDDRTDEDVFEAVGPDAWTVHVGDLRSNARYVLATATDVIALLRSFAAVNHENR